MLCERPFVMNGKAFGCGQCMPCRKNRHRTWSHRIMLESFLWPVNSVVGLSYDDEHMPRLEDGRGILVRKELQDWLKRFRKSLEEVDTKIRYFGVGEYGDLRLRPHFHVVLFNYPRCAYGESRYTRDRAGRLLIKDCCSICDRVRDTWGRGDIHSMELNISTAQYCAQYTTKKMTSIDDPRLKGLSPEFARMSLKPGIGADFMWEVASTLHQFNLVDTQVDVPSTLRHGNRIMPIGRYLQQKLRVYCGKDKKAPQNVLDDIAQELQPLRDYAFENSLPFSKVISQSSEQARMNMESRGKIFKQRKDKL